MPPPCHRSGRNSATPLVITPHAECIAQPVRWPRSSGSTEIDKGLLKASNSPGSDVLSLDCEFTVTEGPFAKRKFWQLFTVTGGKVDDKGASIGWNSKRIFRAMVDSALGLDAEDLSEAAKAKRQLRGLADLNGISFIAKVGVEPNNDPRYPDHNRLDHRQARRQGRSAGLLRAGPAVHGLHAAAGGAVHGNQPRLPRPLP
jgi:hypothetical protein